jgi:hypothetical protein
MVRQIREACRTGDFESGVRLGKSLFLLVLIGSTAAAQEPAPVQPSAQQAVEKQTAAWQALAKNLELRLARMLPCDARVRAAIEEVSRASEARLAARAQYLQDAAANAKRDSEAADAALAADQTGAREMEMETAEAEQDRVAIEGQLADLIESVRAKPALDEARMKLESIAAMVRQRVAGTQSLAGRKTALTAALRETALAFQARQKAIEADVSALATETSRWSEYYAARLVRAQTECSITQTKGRPAQRKRQ